MWVLIITIFANIQVQPVVAMDHIGAFETYEACMLAGAKWGEANMKRAPRGTQMTATCVSKSGAQPVKR